MEATNLFRKLRKINHSVSFNLWHVRIGGIYMALFFLFALGEKFVCKFVPMELTTQKIVSEVMSCTACLILGEEILRALYKLFARRRWAVLCTMAGGFAGGMIVSVIFDIIDKEPIPNDKFIALGCAFVLGMVAYLLWRMSARKVRQIKLERELARKRNLRKGY